MILKALGIAAFCSFMFLGVWGLERLDTKRLEQRETRDSIAFATRRTEVLCFQPQFTDTAFGSINALSLHTFAYIGADSTQILVPKENCILRALE